MNKPMGEILVELGIISPLTLERALGRQKGSGKKLGMVLEEMGVVTEEEVVDVLSRQLSMQTVKKIRGYRFAPELFEMVPAEYAIANSLFPLRLKDGVLAVAVSDPYAIDIVDNLSRKTGLKVMTLLSTEKEIKGAIKEYYLTGNEGSTASLVRVLTVEDSPVVANVIKAALEREGFEVLQAADGLEGLKMAMSFKPSVILCDSVMPKMDGFGLKRALSAQAETAKIPVILLTSKASPEEEQKALSSGFFDFIAKPVNAVRIVSRVRRAIEMSASPPR
ncbi:protein PilH [Geobacter sp. OR-1]|uniref:response regulator n=1 Tax=Geobacter sp. OR-1 TaxID=1266765 RepID=UPI000541D4E2|nr:response regulator [Geobacter sp. OR-1]GAM09831.1 protein PilH [Geobacter sp. OR-1]